MNEERLIERIAKLAGKPHGRLALGIGDDCAIYRPSAGEELLFTTDQLIEGIHFLPEADAATVGERALARSLSDIAAMGGVPRFCLVSLALPGSKSSAWAEKFFRGLLRLARKSKTDLAGGDLARDEKVRCDVMVCGSAPRGKALRRSGARAGDILYVSGKLGKGWNRPIRPRLELGLKLRGKATSCIDLSDGISLDLHRVALASGVSARLDRVPVAPGSTLTRALHGGEDYELLFTLPPSARPPRGVTMIGTITRGKPGTVYFQDNLLPAMGYDHFSEL